MKLSWRSLIVKLGLSCLVFTQVVGTFIPEESTSRLALIVRQWEGLTHLAGWYRFFIPANGWNRSFYEVIVQLDFKDGSQRSGQLAEILGIDSLRDLKIVEWLKQKGALETDLAGPPSPALVQLATYSKSRFPEARSVTIEVRRFHAPAVGTVGDIEEQLTSRATVSP